MQKIIVLGATSGIGRAVARIYAARGCRVCAAGRRTELLQSLQLEFPDQIFVYPVDISDCSMVAHHLGKMTETLQGLDLLILSSGVGRRNSELDAATEQIIVATNVAGFTAVVDWSFNYFRQQQRGHIVAISSVAGLRGNRFAPGYGAAKAYNINYMQSLRQLAHHEKLDIVLTDVRPGFVDTVMAQGDGVFWSAPVEKAARQLVRAVDRRCSVVYVTKRWRYVALLIKIIPPFIFEKL
jgi:short-subunit dehydrogenase